jgi:hypothetical protein
MFFKKRQKIVELKNKKSKEELEEMLREFGKCFMCGLDVKTGLLPRICPKGARSCRALKECGVEQVKFARGVYAYILELEEALKIK